MATELELELYVCNKSLPESVETNVLSSIEASFNDGLELSENEVDRLISEEEEIFEVSGI